MVTRIQSSAGGRRRRKGWVGWIVLTSILTALGGLVGHMGIGALEEVGARMTQWIWPTPSGEVGNWDDLRLTYYRFEGPTMLDQIRKGRALSATDGFVYEPLWLKNEVFDNVTKILEASIPPGRPQPSVDTSNDSLPYSSMEVEVFDREGVKTISRSFRKEDTDPLRRKLVKSFRGALGSLRGGNGMGSVNIDELIDRLKNSREWTINVPWWVTSESSADAPIKWDRYEVVGRISAEEALRYLADPLSRAVLRRNPDARDVIVMKIYATHGRYYGALLIREVKLLVAALENIGNKPLFPRRLVQRHLGGDWLRVVPVTATETAAEEAREEVVDIPVEALKPGEHLMIPLRLELGVATRGRSSKEGTMTIEDLPQSWWDATAGDTIKLEILRTIDEKWGGGKEIIEIGKDALESKRKAFAGVGDPYVLGPSVDVRAVILQKGGREERRDVRRFDSTNIVVSGGFEQGSCPVLYVDRDGEWQRLGRVLVDAVVQTGYIGNRSDREHG